METGVESTREALIGGEKQKGLGVNCELHVGDEIALTTYGHWSNEQDHGQGQGVSIAEDGIREQ